MGILCIKCGYIDDGTRLHYSLLDWIRIFFKYGCRPRPPRLRCPNCGAREPWKAV